MAETFFNKYSQNDKAISAGLEETQPRMHKFVINAMKEENIDITNNISKLATKEMLKNSDLIILMSKNLSSHLDFIKSNTSAKIEIWDIPDIHASESDNHLYPEFQKAREIIKDKVLTLTNNLNKKKRIKTEVNILY